MDNIDWQQRLDALVSAFPARLAAGEDRVLEWLRDFAAANEDSTLRCDRRGLALQLTFSGYRSDVEGAVKLKEHGAEAFRRRIIEFSLYFLERDQSIPVQVKQMVDYYFENR